jgi:hypothetical protein
VGLTSIQIVEMRKVVECVLDCNRMLPWEEHNLGGKTITRD